MRMYTALLCFVFVLQALGQDYGRRRIFSKKGPMLPKPKPPFLGKPFGGHVMQAAAMIVDSVVAANAAARSAAQSANIAHNIAQDTAHIAAKSGVLVPGLGAGPMLPAGPVGHVMAKQSHRIAKTGGTFIPMHPKPRMPIRPSRKHFNPNTKFPVHPKPFNGPYGAGINPIGHQIEKEIVHTQIKTGGQIFPGHPKPPMPMLKPPMPMHPKPVMPIHPKPKFPMNPKPINGPFGGPGMEPFGHQQIVHTQIKTGGQIFPGNPKPPMPMLKPPMPMHPKPVMPIHPKPKFPMHPKPFNGPFGGPGMEPFGNQQIVHTQIKTGGQIFPGHPKPPMPMPKPPMPMHPKPVMPIHPKPKFPMHPKPFNGPYGSGKTGGPIFPGHPKPPMPMPKPPMPMLPKPIMPIHPKPKFPMHPKPFNGPYGSGKTGGPIFPGHPKPPMPMPKPPMPMHPKPVMPIHPKPKFPMHPKPFNGPFGGPGMDPFGHQVEKQIVHNQIKTGGPIFPGQPKPPMPMPKPPMPMHPKPVMPMHPKPKFPMHQKPFNGPFGGPGMDPFGHQVEKQIVHNQIKTGGPIFPGHPKPPMPMPKPPMPIHPKPVMPIHPKPQFPMHPKPFNGQLGGPGMDPFGHQVEKQIVHNQIKTGGPIFPGHPKPPMPIPKPPMPMHPKPVMPIHPKPKFPVHPKPFNGPFGGPGMDPFGHQVEKQIVHNQIKSGGPIFPAHPKPPMPIHPKPIMPVHPKPKFPMHPKPFNGPYGSGIEHQIEKEIVHTQIKTGGPMFPGHPKPPMPIPLHPKPIHPKPMGRGLGAALMQVGGVGRDAPWMKDIIGKDIDMGGQIMVGGHNKWPRHGGAGGGQMFANGLRDGWGGDGNLPMIAAVSNWVSPMGSAPIPLDYAGGPLPGVMRGPGAAAMIVEGVAATAAAAHSAGKSATFAHGIAKDTAHIAAKSGVMTGGMGPGGFIDPRQKMSMGPMGGDPVTAELGHTIAKGAMHRAAKTVDFGTHGGISAGDPLAKQVARDMAQEAIQLAAQTVAMSPGVGTVGSLGLNKGYGEMRRRKFHNKKYPKRRRFH